MSSSKLNSDLQSNILCEKASCEILWLCSILHLNDHKLLGTMANWVLFGILWVQGCSWIFAIMIRLRNYIGLTFPFRFVLRRIPKRSESTQVDRLLPTPAWDRSNNDVDSGHCRGFHSYIYRCRCLQCRSHSVVHNPIFNRRQYV